MGEYVRVTSCLTVGAPLSHQGQDPVHCGAPERDDIIPTPPHPTPHYTPHHPRALSLSLVLSLALNGSRLAERTESAVSWGLPEASALPRAPCLLLRSLSLLREERGQCRVTDRRLAPLVNPDLELSVTEKKTTSVVDWV